MEYQQPFFQKRIFTMRYRTLNKNWHFHANSNCFLYKVQKEALHKKAAGIPAAQKLLHLTVISS